MASLEEIIQERKKKISGLRDLGINPYPEKTNRDSSIKEVLENFDEFVKENKEVCLAGRIMSIRGHGALMFSNLMDESGKIQFLLKKDELGDEKMDLFKNYFDMGDFIEIKGSIFVTNTNEKTVLVKDFKILCKSLRPIPTEWFGLEDEEERLRRRYLDLILNKEVKETFDLRIDLMRYIREFFYDLGFKEVETPILQPVYGGALAQPFMTHLNALDMDVYLRIAPELYLKRLLIGGYEKIFEIAKCFRNEGIDREHNPEFTNLELYWVWSHREGLMNMLEDMVKFLIEKLGDKSGLKLEDISFPFERITFSEFIKSKSGLDFDKGSLVDFQEYLKKNHIEFEKGESKAKLGDLVVKQFRGELIKPTFITDDPLELSPLAKQDLNDLEHTLRFHLYIDGKEICNGFSELNDAMDQRKRFEEQESMHESGDKDAHPLDTDFVDALEYGMPPTGGLGIGIERLITVLLGKGSLKEILFFPFLKNKE